MSKGLILKDSAHKTTLHKNARKYTQKISKNRILLLIMRLLQLFLRKNNIKITFERARTPRYAPQLADTTKEATQTALRSPATTFVTARVAFATHTLPFVSPKL